MDGWEGWELGRVIVAFAAVLYLGVWAQLTLFHWAGAFRRWEMIPPVLVTPIIAVLALLGVVSRDGVLGWLALGGLAVGVLEGVIGLLLHGRAMVAQVGGPTLRNMMAGPPPVLPLAYSLVGVLGLLGLVWDA
jgi:hypothetical protein